MAAYNHPDQEGPLTPASPARMYFRTPACQTSPTVPDAPTDLTATTVGATRIDLSWSAPSNDGGSAVTEYKVYRKIAGTAWAGNAQIASSATTSYSDATVECGKSYTYDVKAVNSVGESNGYSNEASATTTQCQASGGSVALRVKNVGASSPYAASAILCELWDWDTDALVDTVTTADGNCQWSNVPAGSYYARVWKPHSSGSLADEYWGVSSKITSVPYSGEFTRNAPHTSVGSTVPSDATTKAVGEVASQSITVKNHRSSPASVRLHCVWDVAGDSTFDEQETTSYASIAAGGTRQFTCDHAIGSQMGGKTYKFGYQVITDFSNAPNAAAWVTDSYWTSATLTVTDDTAGATSLGAPTDPQPGSSSQGSPARITATQRFTWGAASGSVAGYQVNFRNMATDAVTSYDAGNHLYWTLPAGTLAEGATYRWGVWAYDGNGNHGPQTDASQNYVRIPSTEADLKPASLLATKVTTYPASYGGYIQVDIVLTNKGEVPSEAGTYFFDWKLFESHGCESVGANDPISMAYMMYLAQAKLTGAEILQCIELAAYGLDPAPTDVPAIGPGESYTTRLELDVPGAWAILEDNANSLALAGFIQPAYDANLLRIRALGPVNSPGALSAPLTWQTLPGGALFSMGWDCVKGAATQAMAKGAFDAIGKGADLPSVESLLGKQFYEMLLEVDEATVSAIQEKLRAGIGVDDLLRRALSQPTGEEAADYLAKNLRRLDEIQPSGEPRAGMAWKVGVSLAANCQTRVAGSSIAAFFEFLSRTAARTQEFIQENEQNQYLKERLIDQLFQVMSPMDVVLVDDQGRRTGVWEGAVLTEIPGSQAYLMGDKKLIILPPGTEAEVELQGTGEGLSHFVMVTTQGETVVWEIPTTTTTSARSSAHNLAEGHLDVQSGNDTYAAAGEFVELEPLPATETDAVSPDSQAAGHVGEPEAPSSAPNQGTPSLQAWGILALLGVAASIARRKV